jgi:hypothetical protein
MLISAEGRLTEEDRKTLAQNARKMELKIVLIPVVGRDDFVILKTNVMDARVIRESILDLAPGGKKLSTVITSGCIGKLKKRATQTRERDLGVKVSQ